MAKPPRSYINAKRPPILEALILEGETPRDAMESLTRKGYFEPPPRPWSLGFKDRGQGHGDFAILDCFEDVVTEAKDRSTAEFIIAAANAYKPYPPLRPGTPVKTTQEDSAVNDWTEEVKPKRKWGIKGTILRHHDSHGLCYDVQHADGSEGCYDPSELAPWTV